MEQVQVLSAVCKKLNGDIEALGAQTAMRESAVAKLSSNQQAFDDQLRQLNMDLQIKLSRTDAIVQKLQSDVEQMSHSVREVLNGQQEANRTNLQRYQEVKVEVIDLRVSCSVRTVLVDVFVESTRRTDVQRAADGAAHVRNGYRARAVDGRLAFACVRR